MSPPRADVSGCQVLGKKSDAKGLAKPLQALTGIPRFFRPNYPNPNAKLMRAKANLEVTTPSICPAFSASFMMCASSYAGGCSFRA